MGKLQLAKGNKLLLDEAVASVHLNFMCSSRIKDWGYLYKLIAGDLPPTRIEFLRKMHEFFPNNIDVKYILEINNHQNMGLQRTATRFSVRIIHLQSFCLICVRIFWLKVAASFKRLKVIYWNIDRNTSLACSTDYCSNQS